MASDVRTDAIEIEVQSPGLPTIQLTDSAVEAVQAEAAGLAERAFGELSGVAAGSFESLTAEELLALRDTLHTAGDAIGTLFA